MMPIKLLMDEHRLIERMIKVMSAGLESVRKENAVNGFFVDSVVDFIRMYADRCHHGKEENILFRELAKKDISAEHRNIMEELIKEHALGRNNVRKLIEAKEKYAGGNQNALKDIISNMEILVEFYPVHIEKEDEHFFIPCMEYFTEEERNKMLDEMREFDSGMIHRKYAEVVEGYERRD